MGRDLVWTVPNNDVRGCLTEYTDGRKEVQPVTPDEVLDLITVLEKDTGIVKITLIGEREFDEHKRRSAIKSGGGIRLA